MKLVKITTPTKSILTIDISKFKKAKVIKSNVLEVMFENTNDDFLIKGNVAELDEIIDTLVEEKNKYEKEFKFLEEKDMFYEKLVKKLSKDISEANKDVLKDEAYNVLLGNVQRIADNASKTLNRLENYEDTVEKNKKDLDEITMKISELKKELF